MATHAKRDLPPCPGNPTDYLMVNRNRKFYWRLKRGRRSPAVLNNSLQARADAMKALKITIGELRHTIAHFIQPLHPGNLHQRLFGLLQATWVEDRKIDYRKLAGMEVQAEWRLDKMLQSECQTRHQGSILQLVIPAMPFALRAYNKYVTEFVLEALMVSGTDAQLRSRGETSAIYDVQQGIPADCVFEFEPPAHEPWLLLLKVHCFEGASCAVNPKHYAVKVVAVG